MALDNFSSDEQFLLHMLPAMVGSTVAFSAKSSAADGLREMLTSNREYLAASEDFPDNALIQKCLPNVDDRDAARDEVAALKEASQKRLESLGIESQEQLQEQLFKDCETVSAALRQHSTAEEAAQYRDWLITIATEVARSAREGGFLGIGGVEVSPDEERVLNGIRSALTI